MENTGIKTLGKVMYIGGMVALGIIMVIGGFTIFPVIEYRGNTIRMFAPERLLGRMPRIQEIMRPEDLVVGWVLGEHVLRTEHGAKIYDCHHRVFGFDRKFISGTSSS